MRKHLVLPLAVALMMFALLPTPALAYSTCSYSIVSHPNATPSAQSVKQGATAYYAVTVVTTPAQYAPRNPSVFFSTLSVKGLPAGFTATFTSNGYNTNDQPVGQLAVKTTTGHLGTYTLQIIGPSQPCSSIFGNYFTLTVTQ